MVKFRPASRLPAGRTPLVSVVVPCYNYGRFLPQCIGSLLAQSDVAVEVLIIDDASRDNSAELAKDLAARDPRVSVIVHDRNHGHIATYNEGLAHARGEYSVLLSADDMLPAGSLARAVALMESEASVGLVYGSPFNFSESDPPGQAVPNVRLVRLAWARVGAGAVPERTQLHLLTRGGNAHLGATGCGRVPARPPSHRRP